jgi:hypothetical protein
MRGYCDTFLVAQKTRAPPPKALHSFPSNAEVQSIDRLAATTTLPPSLVKEKQLLYDQ